jgi:hypothetical protein
LSSLSFDAMMPSPFLPGCKGTSVNPTPPKIDVVTARSQAGSKFLASEIYSSRYFQFMGEGASIVSMQGHEAVTDETDTSLFYFLQHFFNFEDRKFV